jgi:transposase InsO family protein
MGDPQKPGEFSADKLYEMFSKIFEQQQMKTIPEIFRYALEPNPVKLSGPGNYISWARHAQLILSSHGYGDLLLPNEKVDIQSDASAKQINDKVLVWMLGSMEPTVREQVETMASVSEVWTALENQFAGKSNKMQATRVMHELTHLKQDSKSITEYAGEMKKLYRDLHYYHPFEPVDKRDLAIHHRWFESFVSKIFLDGLDQKFNLRRQLIFSKPEWPSLEDIVSNVMEEETRLADGIVDSQKVADARAAMSQSMHIPRKGVSADNNKWFCDYCKKKGHSKENCYKLHGFPPGWQKGRSQQGGVVGGKWKNANHAAPTGEVPAVDLQALEEFKSKLKISEGSSSSQGSSKADSSFFVTSEGMKSQAHTSTTQSRSWIIDTGATNHMTGASHLFSSYKSCSGKDKVRVANGSTSSIIGRGSIWCTKTLSLSPVLHVPNFPVNLLSVSSITKSLNCIGWFDPTCCAFQEIGTGRLLGTGTVRDGLYYLDQGSDEVALATCMSPSQELYLYHCRLGHLSFSTLSRIYPSLFSSCHRESLVCDACELAKHTRGTYPSRALRSNKPFDVIHSDVWGPCEVHSISGHRWFVTFIDCFSRYTWLYLLKNKSDVFSVFKDLFALIRNQFGTTIKILRSDNGTEYINHEFGQFLASNGIEHQTTCVNTPEQNGVAERKNRHLLEVARSLMFTMNVPKFLWGEAIKTATYLINRMPLRVLDFKTPAECLLKTNDFLVPPKVFGCVCFVHDYRNSVGKLDPRAIKCVFMGYSPSQKGYRCWCPSEHRFFVSMDVTFREHESFYGPANETGITLSPPEAQQEGESNGGTLVGSILVPTSGVPSINNNTHSQGEYINNESGSNDSNSSLEDMQDATGDSSPPSQDGEPPMHEDPGTNSLSFSPVTPTSTMGPGDNQLATPNPQNDLPIALRKPTRSLNVPRYLKDYIGHKHDIAHFMSYKHCSPSFQSFLVSLDSVPIPTTWEEAKEDPKWKEAMLEEMRALEKNKTWELVDLPLGKQPVGCKWVFTIKHTPEGKVDRYKARLVAKGYTQTYGIDYEETFAPVAKMNSVRTLLSCAVNFDWNIYQMDVKNAFLHGDLQEEVYMHIPPGFNTNQTTGKVLRLYRSLYGLKQSPRAWFDRFRRAILKKGYCQSNADHTLFYKRNIGKITILIVYVDDIVITGDDHEEIAHLKKHLAQEFEVKDLGQLRYFLGIEVSRGPKGIFISQRKYVLDLLREVGMLGCRPASTPIEQNHRLMASEGRPVDRECYQRTVGKLIYLSHTRPDIAFAVSVVSQFMHDPRSSHMDAVTRILRYLKGCPAKGLLYTRQGSLQVECYTDADWAGSLDDRRSTSGYCTFVGGNIVSWRSKKQTVVARSTAEAEFRSMAHGVCEVLWLRILLTELGLFQDMPLMLYCDNKAAIDIANNPVQHDRTKHVEIDRHFIKEKLDRGIICMPYVSSTSQIADVLTKGLPEKSFSIFCSKMGLYDVFAPS